MFIDPLKMGYGLQYVLGPDSSIRSWAVEWFNQLQLQSELPAFCQSGKKKIRKINDGNISRDTSSIWEMPPRCHRCRAVGGGVGQMLDTQVTRHASPYSLSTNACSPRICYDMSQQ